MEEADEQAGDNARMVAALRAECSELRASLEKSSARITSAEEAAAVAKEQLASLQGVVEETGQVSSHPPS